MKRKRSAGSSSGVSEKEQGSANEAPPPRQVKQIKRDVKAIGGSLHFSGSPYRYEIFDISFHLKKRPSISWWVEQSKRRNEKKCLMTRQIKLRSRN